MQSAQIKERVKKECALTEITTMLRMRRKDAKFLLILTRFSNTDFRESCGSLFAGGAATFRMGSVCT
jgi:hypothetical protein